MADKLTKMQLAEYKEAFNLFDKDRNGTICTHELRNVMHALGQSPSDQEIADMIACSDKDGSGNIDLNEFLHLMTSSQKQNMGEIRTAFKMMDKDKDGFISFDDLKRTMTECKESLSDSELQRMITDADIDLDGRVCYTEFVQFFQREY
ncbi:calmodulin isoform X2 [Exaiptasia diaphana]|uniref:EF-hand domain-containing protein n=1 Tax=Exaiptasia diaphana TaxID=2652724 RepID=A0A913YA63_EXADI|nr:calmodulin isoform X2 [Exaiptasia diaphana]